MAPLPDAPDRDLYALATRLRLKSDEPVPRVVNPEPVSYEAGRRDIFWVANLEDTEMFQMEAILTHVSEHAYWYFEEGLEPPPATLQLAVRAFEERVYPAVATYFGREWSPGVDNDPHITILHGRLEGAAGYYNSSDEYPKAIDPFSNEREMFYVNLDSLTVGSFGYLGTLAHELQHAAHWASDPNEETWVNEGLSEVAKRLAGYGLGFVQFFKDSPSISLTTWASQRYATLPHYGAASLFMEYLGQHYGGHENLRLLVERPEDGAAGVTAYLASLGYRETFEDVLQEWLVSNYLDPLEIAPYYYDNVKIGLGPDAVMEGFGVQRGTVSQHAGEYVEIELNGGNAQILFNGRVETPLLPTAPHSGTFCWWGNRGDSIGSTLTADFDLTGVSRASLKFWTWYAIEESWDYAYVEVSTDGGRYWDILQGTHVSPENPVGIGFGPGYTGASGGWLEESVDLTPYVGRSISVRFEYVTDSAINEDGICIDDISIPEIGYADDAESDGRWNSQGFVRTDNRVEQRYLVQVIEIGDEVLVRDMPVDGSGEGSLVVEGFGDGLERVVVVIAPVAPKTTQPSSYVLVVGPVPD